MSGGERAEQIQGFLTGTGQHVLLGFCDTGPHLDVGLIPENSLARFVLNVE